MAWHIIDVKWIHCDQVQHFDAPACYEPRPILILRIFRPMTPPSKPTIGVIASLPESLINFRGRLLRTFVERGYRVVAYAPAAGSTDQKLAAIGVQFKKVSLDRTSLNLFGDLRTLWSLYRSLRRERPAVVLSYTIKPVIYGTIAAVLAGVRVRTVIITGLGYLFTGNSRRRALLRLAILPLYRYALGRADCIFFQNNDDLTLLRQHRVVSARSNVTVVAGSGVDLQHFAQKPVPSQLSFLMIARLVRDKGVVEYVDAARRLRRAHPEVPCRLVGSLDANPSSITQEQLDSWIRDGDIEYLGELADVRPAIEATAVYVLPSYREGMPRTVLEAMATGRPVITTDAPGCRDTIVDGESGWFGPVQDADKLFIAMSRFLAHPTSVSVMGLAARNQAEQKFDVQIVNSQIIDAIERQLSKR